MSTQETAGILLVCSIALVSCNIGGSVANAPPSDRCREGSSRCMDGDVQACVSGTWRLKEDCVSPGLACIETKSGPRCEGEITGAEGFISEVATEPGSEENAPGQPESGPGSDAHRISGSAPSDKSAGHAVVRGSTAKADSDSRTDADSDTAARGPSFDTCTASSEGASGVDATAAADTAPPLRPNVVLIVADDQGYHDVGVYGATDIATPTLDTMAAEGLRFTAFYAGSNVCTPSRAALMTGAYAPRSGFSRGGVGSVLFPTHEVGISEEEITIAELLQEAGYATAVIGKWHLGHHPPFLPTRHGFDSYYGIPYSNDMSPRYLLENETIVEEAPPHKSLIQKYTARALEFIEANPDTPFFLYLAHSMPHYPVRPSEAFAGHSPYGKYGDVIEELDWSTEQILLKLDELDLEEKTLVIYTSDNGGQIERDGELLGRNTPLRGRKAENWEGGMRVPCIMRWSSTLPRGCVIDEVAAFIDLYPTLAHLAGAAIPEDRTVDGVDIWPIMAEEAVAADRYFYYSLGGAVRFGRWKLTGSELFDLENDIGETTNLANQMPDLAAELQEAMDTFNADVNRSARPLADLADFSEEERQPSP